MPEGHTNCKQNRSKKAQTQHDKLAKDKESFLSDYLILI